MKTSSKIIFAILLSVLCLVLLTGGKMVVELKNSNEYLQESVQTLKQENRLLHEETQLWEVKFNSLEETLETLMDKNKELTDERIELENQLKETEKELEESQKQWEEERQTWKKEKEALEKKLTKASAPKPETSKPAVQPEGEKTAYLTFDDGPSDNTKKILDTLKQYNIKATFFVNGKSSQKALYQRMVDEGHVIGNHTYSHDYAKIYTASDSFWTDFDKLNDFLEETVGIRPNIMRFPGGSNNTVSHKYGGKQLMQKLVNEAVEKGYQYFDWNVSSRDAEKNKQDKSVIIQSVLDGAKSKKTAVILMHDSASKTTTAEALPEIIEGLKEMGYGFASLDENSYAPHFQKVN